MTLDLALSPSGRLTISSADHPANSDAGRIAKAFSEDAAPGLFALAAHRLDASWSLSAGYWREFAARYLSELCQTPSGTDAAIEEIPPPSDLPLRLLSAPPMTGAEYLSRDVLESLWRDLDVWVRQEIAEHFQEGLSDFLAQRAPLWRQVGRVCFHLAENRRDPEYPFAFLATYASHVSDGGKIQYQPLSKALQEYAGAKNKKALIQLLSPVQAASEASVWVKELVDSGDIYHPLAWTSPQAHRFLLDAPKLKDSGIVLRLPDWWRKRPRPRVNVTIGGKKRNKLGADGMLDFKIQAALGDQKLTAKEWKELLNSENGLVLLRGQWVEVDKDKLQETLNHWQAIEQQTADGISFLDGMRLLAGASSDLAGQSEQDDEHEQWAFVDAGDWLGKTLADLRSPENLQASQPGDALKATLREYQNTGVSWLRLLCELGLGACLADDMGLGKTIQIISLLLVLKKKKRTAQPSLLVLPASLLANWKSELAKFAPSLRTRFVHASQISKDELETLSADPEGALKKTDVVLTTYGMLLRQDWLLDVKWRLAVLDEAQAIKNPSARQTKAVKKLQAESRIALTGTPVENRLGDLWSLFDFLCPGLLGTQQKFKSFIKSLEERKTDRYAPLRRLVEPYILRRLKTDKRVIADLPEKTELNAYCGLSKRQAALYSKLVDELAEALEDEENKEGIQRRGLVLSYLMRFKQLCDHPNLLSPEGEFASEDSGKFARLAEICEEVASRQEKILIFTQFREMADPLANFLSSIFGRSGLILHGGTPVKQRKQRVDSFQQEDGPPFFILSLKAGGVGLNLTAASHVVHFDRWWNPAVEKQAEDRAFRIGQKRNVLVHRFICQGTVEEKIHELIEEKSQLAADLLEGGAEKMLTEMSDSELIQLVSIDVERAKL